MPPNAPHDPLVPSALGLRRYAMPGFVLLLGAVVAVYLLRTSPKTIPEPELKKPKTVQTRAVKPDTHRIRILGYGSVIPAKEVTLSSQVSGRVVRQHSGLVPGGYVSEGEEILGIDEADYQIAIAEQQASLAEAQSELQLEQGRQVVAAREWEQLKTEMPNVTVNRDLVLRAPHLRKIEATIDRANQLIAKAALDLQRTSMTAPFNALVLEESVEMGQLINVGDTIATLAGADEFWVQVSVRQDELVHIQLPAPGKPGASATITLETGQDGVVYQGEVIRLLSDLEPNGLNARVIVRVADPLGLSTGSDTESPATPLLLRSFVRVNIDAGALTDAIALDVALLDEGQVWVVDASSTLQIRQAHVLWRQPRPSEGGSGSRLVSEIVYIANTLEPGDEIVAGNLRAGVPGAKVEARRQQLN